MKIPLWVIHRPANASWHMPWEKPLSKKPSKSGSSCFAHAPCFVFCARRIQVDLSVHPKGQIIRGSHSTFLPITDTGVPLQNFRRSGDLTIEVHGRSTGQGAVAAATSCLEASITVVYSHVPDNKDALDESSTLWLDIVCGICLPLFVLLTTMQSSLDRRFCALACLK
ncbi:uncharacterized protein BO88DRAFT_222702 [Aspergillus vadensis CBS 113365]|uniref:Uncharacterized protein n=1 Tax=Aspergillus vadensis (strain CBS 113365 / IMI 142717 / IBT 24658) TaxID=1448311 RepID=A0A319AV56_ASPVC|nr:hypothetical protein BO88DRAFT_222702 [Aspergillus vadensis CBS 113365]PYH63251.1 hypothetical protein BO88DRAFT_222702 [Aspergillus vadensis CBS 113365]